MAQHTIRDQFKFATGTIVYEDYPVIDCVHIPFSLTINASPEDDPDDFYHKITVKSAAFNVGSRNSLHVSDEIEEIGDAK